MRRLTLLTTAALGLAVAACEDGPNQTFSAPPQQAGWNDGRAYPSDGGLPVVPNGTATNASAPFASADGGPIGSSSNNANEICTPQQIAARNPILNSAPIMPPNQAAGLNIAGSDGNGGTTWAGLTIEQAEQINCQGTSESDLFGQANYLSVAWNNGSVVAEYYVPTHKVDYIGVGPGLGGGQYQGTMVITGLPDSTGTTHQYTIYVDAVTLIDDQATDSSGNVTHTPTDLQWDYAQAGVPADVVPFDNLYRAAMNTYRPTFPPEPAGQLCNQTGSCIIGTFPGQSNGYEFIPALGWAMWVGYYGTKTTANAVNRIDINFAQIMDFSVANPVLKLDATGPTTVPITFSDGETCTMNLGLTYGQFFENCVQTTTDSQTNLTAAEELFSNLSHDEETTQFNIAGVDLSFAAAGRLQPTQVLIDPPPEGCAANPSAAGCPQSTDNSFEISVDQSTLGLVANDWQYDSNNNVTVQDLAGAGALYHDFRTLSILQLQQEVCNANPQDPNCAVWFPTAGDGGLQPQIGVVDAGAPTPPSISELIANCVAPRDSNGNLEGQYAPVAVQGGFIPPPIAQAYMGGVPGILPVGCTGMELLLSADIPQKLDGNGNPTAQPDYDDPVDIGPIVTQISGSYTLGMKMGHQQGVWCLDAMSVNQIAAQSSVTIGTANPRPLTTDEVNQIGEIGQGAYATNVGATALTLALPQYCLANNLLPTSQVQATDALAGGNDAALPIDVQGGVQGTPSPRFFFKEYGLALIQTLEASTGTQARPNGGLSMPVTSWGTPAIGSPMPVSVNDLYFDSDGDGQFETMEYVDRRFVCPDGANDCPSAGDTNFSCPTNSCTVGTTSNGVTCTANVGQPMADGTLTCNPNETAQPPTDLVFNADVKDGIMNAYDVNRYLYRGETALYQSIAPAGYATAQASNAFLSNIFGSALLNALGPAAFPMIDLTGNVLNESEYDGAFNGTPLSLSFGQGPTSPLQLQQVNTGQQQAYVNYAGNPGAPFGSQPWTELVPWTPKQPLNGFDEADYGNSMLDYFVPTASIDFTGITITGLVDYDVFTVPSGGGVPSPDGNPNDYGSTLALEEMAAESTNFLGDVFLCYEPAANPPVLAVRMYTPTQAVLNWLNSNPSSYADCGIVVRWSPYDSFVNLIESTTYGVRLQVTQGGGLGRIVGAQVYVPGLPFEE